MTFTPVISPDLKVMDERIFRDQPMGLTLESTSNVTPTQTVEQSVEQSVAA